LYYKDAKRRRYMGDLDIDGIKTGVKEIVCVCEVVDCIYFVEDEN
jgi:hypothetical protein